MYPVLVRIGPINIYSYGVMLALAFLVAIFLARRHAISLGMDGDAIIDLGIWLIISGILGARLLYVLLNLNYYRDVPLEAVMIWKGGLVWYGGLISAVLVAMGFLRKRKMPILKTGDLMLPYVALGQAIGRIGCFLNGCCYGKPTALAFGVSFTSAQAPVHPTQLYESAAMFLLYLVLRKIKPGNGKTILLYLLFYSTFRFFNEFLRGDNPIALMGLTISQIISVIVFIIAIILWRSLPSR